MKTFFRLAIACVLIIHARAADGWEKVKWGMTMEQVREVYPKAVVPEGLMDDQKTRTLDGEQFPYKSTLKLEEFVKESVEFKVIFFFSEGKRLVACHLATPPSWEKRVDLTPAYDRLVNSITKGGGESEEKMFGKGFVKRIVWKDGETEVRCSLLLFRDPMRSVINLYYLNPGGFKSGR